MARKSKPPWNFPPEIRAIWRAAPKLTLCPRFRRAGTDKVLFFLDFSIYRTNQGVSRSECHSQMRVNNRSGIIRSR